MPADDMDTSDRLQDGNSGRRDDASQALLEEVNQTLIIKTYADSALPSAAGPAGGDTAHRPDATFIDIIPINQLMGQGNDHLVNTAAGSRIRVVFPVGPLGIDNIVVMPSDGERRRIAVAAPGGEGLVAGPPAAGAADRSAGPLDATSSAVPGGHVDDRRYTTATRDGSYQVDTDRFGAVRALAFVDEFGTRRAVSGAALLQLLQTGAQDGWRSARGSDGGRVITAPDGTTTYHLDALGRLRTDAGSVRSSYGRPPIMTSPFIGREGYTRYDSIGAYGETRLAVTDRFGAFTGLSFTYDGGQHSRTISAQSVAQSLSRVPADQPSDLGNGWTATRLSQPGGALPPDTICLAHQDGTQYYITPDGLLALIRPAGDDPRHNIIRLATRLEATTSPVALTDGITGTRYTTPDRRGSGTNSVDVDYLGVARLFSHSFQGSAHTLSFSSLSSVPSDGRTHTLSGGWQVSRTGTGFDTRTIVVAPDGRTTYHLDAMGRFTTDGRSSIAVTAFEDSALATAAGGQQRRDTLMDSGAIASGVLGADGKLAQITIRGTTTTITRQQWERVRTLAPGAHHELGSGWSAHRVGSAGAGDFPVGSIMIIHQDGTAFFVDNEGRLRAASPGGGARSSRWRALRR